MLAVGTPACHALWRHLPAEDGREPVEVNVAPGHDADDVALPRPAGERCRNTRCTRTLRDDMGACREYAHGRRNFLDGRNQGAIQDGLRTCQHVREHRATADAVDEGWPIVHRLRLARRQGGCERRSRIGFRRVDPAAGCQSANCRTDAAREAASAPGNHDGVRVRQVLQDLEADGAVACDHPRIVEGMYERRVEAWISPVLEGLPPALERCQDDTRAETFDGRKLGLRCRRRRDHGAGYAEFPRTPRDTLRHVAGRSREHPTLKLGRGHGRHDIRGAANLERANRLQVLELEPDAAGWLLAVQPYQGCPVVIATGTR